MSSVFSLQGKYNSIAAIIGGAILASLLISLLLIRPAWAKLGQLGREIPVENQKRDDLKNQLVGLQKAKDYFAGHQNDVDQVNIAVPVDPQIPQVLVVLADLAKQNQVRLTSFVPQQTAATSSQAGTAGAAAAPGTTGAAAAPTGAAAPQSVEITANFQGSYGSLIGFFYTLEKSLRLVDVKTITVTGGGQSTSTMTGSITFKAYYKSVAGK